MSGRTTALADTGALAAALTLPAGFVTVVVTCRPRASLSFTKTLPLVVEIGLVLANGSQTAP